MSSEYGIVEITALLGVNTPALSPPGGLQLAGGMHIAGLAEGAPAPGVRSWVLTLDATFVPIPHVAFTAWVNNASLNLLPACGIRFRPVSFPPAVVEIFLVDNTETPVDPADVLGIVPGPIGPNFVSLGVTSAGSVQIPP